MSLRLQSRDPATCLASFEENVAMILTRAYTEWDVETTIFAQRSRSRYRMVRIARNLCSRAWLVLVTFFQAVQAMNSVDHWGRRAGELVRIVCELSDFAFASWIFCRHVDIRATASAHASQCLLHPRELLKSSQAFHTSQLCSLGALYYGWYRAW